MQIFRCHFSISARSLGGTNTLYYRGTDTDVLNGSTQSDLIFGESGNDILNGYANPDVLYGGSGADMLIGGPGNDTLFGGTGDDLYLYYAGDGHDTIIDSDGLGHILYVDADGVYHPLTGGRQISAGSDLYETHAVPGIQYRKETNGDITVLIDGAAAMTLDPPTPFLGINLEDLSGSLLLPSPTHPDYFPPLSGPSVISGDTSPDRPNDYLYAQTATQAIYGLAGNDWLEGDAGVAGFVPTIALYGGTGDDFFMIKQAA